jgi:hypothetical protein
LHFVLILPDGSKSLIPADWTDLTSSAQSPWIKLFEPIPLNTIRNRVPSQDAPPALVVENQPCFSSPAAL